MIESEFYGGCVYLSLSADANVRQENARLWVVSPTTSNLAVLLPESMPAGGMSFVFVNDTTTAFRIRDADNQSVIQVGSRQIAFVVRTETGWIAWAKATNGGLARVKIDTLLVSGGTQGTGTYAYFRASNAWATAVSCPASKIEGCALNLGLSALFVGDDPASSTSTGAHELDQAGAWTSRTAVPFQTARHAAAGRFLFGPTTYAFDREGNAWSTKRTMPITKTRSSAVQISPKRIIIASGNPVPSPNIGYLVTGDAFHTMPNFAGIFRHSPSTFCINGFGFVVGGREDVTPTTLAESERYDHATNTWSVWASLASGRYRGAGAGANGVGYHFGGRDASTSATSTASALLASSWASIASMPGPKSEVQELGVNL